MGYDTDKIADHSLGSVCYRNSKLSILTKENSTWKVNLNEKNAYFLRPEGGTREGVKKKNKYVKEQICIDQNYLFCSDFEKWGGGNVQTDT